MFLFHFLIMLFIAYIPLVLIGYFMPNFTKKTLLFGVVIPADAISNEEVKKIEKDYKRNYGISVVITSILINIISIKMQSVDLLSIGILIMLIIMSANYVYMHNKAKALKQEKDWTVNKRQVVVVDTSHSYNKSYPSVHWFWLPIGIVALTLFFTMIRYPYLPEKIPTNFDFAGEAVNYSDKGFFSVFGLPLQQIGMTAMFYFIYRLIKRVKPNIQASRPKASSKQNQIAKGYWVMYLLGTLVVLNLNFGYIQLNVLQMINPTAAVNLLVYGLATAIPIIGVIIVAMKTGQSGSRIKVEDVDEEYPNVIDRDDDGFWKWGLYYYNPDDPSLFIEKRFGIGWTINCGRPIGMAILIFAILAILAALIAPWI
ncbi:Uncharacterized membrane protein [Natronincola peptidivorans]|uniref:Uncharacterized membrane protein n=1 Tax=Natronincola peptidivorans TaxID=426128 RepID=A0A1I0G7R8_9FIRM|nr:DUF5808 domain-containing protein [Natronincola peptidivorans]SET65978.1 Uncharacterized membrane protein [Natronincola peptidivorans]